MPTRLLIAIAGLIAAITLAGYLVQRRPKPPAPPSAALFTRNGCTLRSYPDEGGTHVSGSQPPDAYTVRYSSGTVEKSLAGTTVTYDSFPPTSGPHYPQWVLWGTYAQPVLEIQAVHNLEHGGVVVQYGRDVPRATVALLKGFVAASPNAMLLAPLPALGGRVALTAWTELALCTRVDRAALTRFRDTYRGKGPERFPVDQLTPGH